MKINWISVDDELPKDGESVLICGQGYDDKKRLAFACFDRKVGWSIYQHDVGKVYYWAEFEANLPEFDFEPYGDYINYGTPQKASDA